MEKKLVILAATLVARLIWRLTKITSGPLRMAVFLAVQAAITVRFRSAVTEKPHATASSRVRANVNYISPDFINIKRFIYETNKLTVSMTSGT